MAQLFMMEKMKSYRTMTTVMAQTQPYICLLDD